MKSKIFNIFFLILLAASPAFGQDFFVARVLEVDSKNMEITVVATVESNINVTVRIAGENNLPQHEGQIFFPECVVSGATIRLWGSTETVEKPVFLATDIRGCRKGGCSDPTGVRLRLRKIRNYESRQPQGDGEHSRTSGRGTGGHGSAGGNGGGNGGGGGGNR